MYEKLHRLLIHPILKRWALKEPNYSFTELSKDRWVLARWEHHFLVKASLQGIWAILPMFLGWSIWIPMMISLVVMLSFKDWKKRPVNILDWICDSSLQIMWPVAIISLPYLIVLFVIYLVTKPYASP